MYNEIFVCIEKATHENMTLMIAL